MNRLLLIVLLLPLAGWGGCSGPVKPDIPKVVYVNVPTPVALPERLTEPCEVTRAKERTVGAVVAAYNANTASLQDCAGRMGEIRALQPGAKGQ